MQLPNIPVDANVAGFMLMKQIIKKITVWTPDRDGINHFPTQLDCIRTYRMCKISTEDFNSKRFLYGLEDGIYAVHPLLRRKLKGQGRMFEKYDKKGTRVTVYNLVNDRWVKTLGMNLT